MERQMIRWGVIGVGNIAARFIASLANSERGRLYAVASHKETVRQQYSMIKAYADYEELLQDEQVDAVYIALPHKMHFEWSIKALRHGKAVLCEKPAVLTLQEMDRLIAAAKENNAFFMEAMKTVFTPGFIKLKEIVKSGAIGKINAIDVNFCSDGAVSGRVLKSSYLFDSDQGGSWYDTASYLIAFVSELYDGKIISAEKKSFVKEGIDWHTEVQLFFEGGQTAALMTAIDQYRERTAVLEGTRGRIIVPTLNRPTEFDVLGETVQHYEVSLIYDDFYGQIEEVHQCLKERRIESQSWTFEKMRRETEILQKIKEGPEGSFLFCAAN